MDALITTDGRVGRLHFLLVHFGSLICFFFFVGIFERLGIKGEATLLGMLPMAVCLWVLVCNGVKRLHDSDRSGWFLLLNFVPILNIYLFYWLLLICPGSYGPNRFGPAPGCGKDHSIVDRYEEHSQLPERTDVSFRQPNNWYQY